MQIHYVTVGQKADIGFTRLKSRCRHAVFLSGGSRWDSVSLLIQAVGRIEFWGPCFLIGCELRAILSFWRPPTLLSMWMDPSRPPQVSNDVFCSFNALNLSCLLYHQLSLIAVWKASLILRAHIITLGPPRSSGMIPTSWPIIYKLHMQITFWHTHPFWTLECRHLWEKP